MSFRAIHPKLKQHNNVRVPSAGAALSVMLSVILTRHSASMRHPAPAVGTALTFGGGRVMREIVAGLFCIFVGYLSMTWAQEPKRLTEAEVEKDLAIADAFLSKRRLK